MVLRCAVQTAGPRLLLCSSLRKSLARSQHVTWQDRELPPLSLARLVVISRPRIASGRAPLSRRRRKPRCVGLPAGGSPLAVGFGLPPRPHGSAGRLHATLVPLRSSGCRPMAAAGRRRQGGGGGNRRQGQGKLGHSASRSTPRPAPTAQALRQDAARHMACERARNGECVWKGGRGLPWINGSVEHYAPAEYFGSVYIASARGPLYPAPLANKQARGPDCSTYGQRQRAACPIPASRRNMPKCCSVGQV